MTWVYELDEDNLFTRKEHLVERDISPYLLKEEDTVIIGEGTCREPFHVRGLVGQSAMSFGSLGAALVNIARGLMFNVGCIQAQVCHTNRCPVGVATTDAKLQRALVVDEKSYRVTNYIISLREGLYNTAAAAGVRSPTELSQEHVIYQEPDGCVRSVYDLSH